MSVLMTLLAILIGVILFFAIIGISVLGTKIVNFIAELKISRNAKK